MLLGPKIETHAWHDLRKFLRHSSVWDRKRSSYVYIDVSPQWFDHQCGGLEVFCVVSSRLGV
jgi:hypothetical protein